MYGGGASVGIPFASTAGAGATYDILACVLECVSWGLTDAEMKVNKQALQVLKDIWLGRWTRAKSESDIFVDLKSQA